MLCLTRSLNERGVELIEFLWLLTGFVLAAWGGSRFVDGAVGVARAHSVSTSVVGVTLAAFATSSPELAVAVASAIDGRPEIALGDVAGSNVANLGLVLGAAVLVRPVVVARSELRRDLPWAVVSVIVVAVMILDDRLGRVEAAILVAVFVGWLSRVLAGSTSRGLDDGSVAAVTSSRRQVWIQVGVGLVALVAAGRLVVVGAEGVGERFGWSDFVVGAILVAVATSMPEFVTVLISVVRGHTGLGVGTLLGSNVFNTMFIVGVASAISEVEVDGIAVSRTLLIGAVAALMVWPWRDSRLGRWQGAVLVSMFVVHLVSVTAGG